MRVNVHRIDKRDRARGGEIDGKERNGREGRKWRERDGWRDMEGEEGERWRERDGGRERVGERGRERERKGEGREREKGV